MNDKTVVRFGNKSLKSISDIIIKENPKKCLLVKGQKSFKFFESEMTKLINSDFDTFTVKESNISFGHLLSGIKYYLNNNCDLIIAIGGGSVMDMAKLISIFSTQEKEPNYYLENMLEITQRQNTLITIPTTSGSGSESTHFAVVYCGIKKYSVSHESLRPDYAIIDPELTYSLSPHQTAVSGMDALCQGIESFWSLNSTNESREYSRESINLILQNIERAVINPSKNSRFSMCKGSYLAGKAINISKTTAAHAFSYPLTILFGIPHGHAVSLSLGQFYEYNCIVGENNKSTEQGNNLLERMAELNKIMNVSNCRQAKRKINYIMERIGLSLYLPDSVDYDKDVNSVIENVNVERLEHHPVKIEKIQFKKIFRSLCH